MTDKESQLDEIEGWAADTKWSQPGTGSENVILEKVLFKPGGLYYEMRRDLEVAHQANSEISKHNQELSKENERLRCPAPERLAEYIKWINNNSAFVVNHLGGQSKDAGFVAIHNWLKAMVK